MAFRKTLVAWVALAAYLPAQETTLRTTVPLVQVPVSVTSKAGQFVYGLAADRGSQTNLTSILPDLQRSGATVYCIEYSAFLTPLTTMASEYRPPEGGRGWILDSITETVHAMKQDTGKILTASTGGRTLKFETKSKLENDLIRLGTDIHSRYMLSFTPARSQECFHHLVVAVKNRSDLTIRARPGYWPIAQ